MTMVLPPEITHAAIHADIGTLQTFLDNVDVRAPDALAEVLPRPAEGALAAPITRRARTGEGKAASPLDLRVGDAARILAPLRAVVSERAVLEGDGVLEPSLLNRILTQKISRLSESSPGTPPQ